MPLICKLKYLRKSTELLLSMCHSRKKLAEQRCQSNLVTNQSTASHKECYEWEMLSSAERKKKRKKERERKKERKEAERVNRWLGKHAPVTGQ